MDSRTNYKNMLLVLLLVVAGLAGAIAPQTAAGQEDYDIRIGGVKITSDNYTNISASGGFPAVKSGTVTFDPATYTLTLNNATIEVNELSIYIEIKKAEPFHIVLVGNNTVRTNIRSVGRGDLSITGSGTLTVGIPYNGYNGIFSAGSLRIEGCTINVGGGISVGSIIIRESDLIIKNATVKAENPRIALLAFGQIRLEGCSVASPSGTEIYDLFDYDSADERYTYRTITLYGKACTAVIIAPGGKVPEKPVFTLEPKELNTYAGAQWYKVYISCNQDFEIQEKETILPSWMSPIVLVDKINSRSFSCLFTTYVNTHGERSGEIIIKTTKGDVKLKVTQEAAAKPEPDEPVFTLDPKELKMEADGGEKEVTLSYPDYFDVKDVKLPSWISQSQFDYSTLYHGCTFKFKFEPNTGAERTADVVIKTDKGDVTLKVTQEGGAKPEVKFTLEPKELKVDADRGKKEVTLRCNKELSIDPIDLPDWISILSLWISEDHKSRKYSLEFQPNPGPERTADVVFKTDLGDVTLKVTQAAGSTKPEPEKAVFTLEPKELKMSADGGKKEVTISCNKAFNIEGWHLPSWLNASTHSKKAETVHKITIQIKPNTGAERMGDVVFDISTDQSQEAVKLKVTQAGASEPKPTLELSTESLTFPAEGGKQTVNVTANGDWYAGLAEGVYAAWVKITPDMAAGTLTVEVGPYKGTKKRAARVAFSSEKKGKDGQPIERSLFVRQEAAKTVEPPVAATGISLNPAAMTMGSGGGTVGFNVYAGKGWTISGSPDWMHPDATRGSGTRLVIVRFDRNESGAERTGKLTVKSDDGKAERTFTLTQRAGQRKPTPSPGSTPSEEYDYDLALNPEEITVGPSDGAGSSISVATSRLWAGSTTEDWIRLESAVGRGNGTFTFTVAPNPSKEMRHGTITVRTQQGMDELKVAIHQQGNDGSVVPPAEVKVSNVTLDPATLTVNGDLSTALISAIVSPDNARNKGLLWMSSNASVATVQVFTPKQSAALPQLRFAPDADDYALVTIVGKGKATITATASDGSGIVARCEVNVLSTVANTVPYAPQAKVYTVGPTLYLSLPTPETVQVYTLAGTLYRTWQAPAGDTSVTLPLGTYIIKVGQLTEKVVVR